MVAGGGFFSFGFLEKLPSRFLFIEINGQLYKTISAISLGR